MKSSLSLKYAPQRCGTGFGRGDRFEAPLCLRLNRINSVGLFRLYFKGVSRLGNGVIWYALLACMPAALGPQAIPLTLHMGVTALFAVALYKLCKKVMVRERPYVTFRSIECHGVPLDRGSFPSGHTIHAVNFTVMLGTLYPVTLWVMVPLMLSIGLSRVVLGQHYPSDVLAGAAIGFMLGKLSLALMPFTIGQ